MMSRSLIIYFSRRGQNYSGGHIVSLNKGNSERIAEFIQKYTGADMFEVRTIKDYPEDFKECTEVAREELHRNARPRLEEYLDGLSGYDWIFVVGPCWWGTFPMAVYTQLEQLDFTGKKVLPIMTHEGSGMGSADRDLKRICSGARIIKGLAIQGSRAADAEQTIADWVDKYIKKY